MKQHLAAIRMLFDWLVTGQVVATNPAHSVRGPKHVVKTGVRTVALCAIDDDVYVIVNLVVDVSYALLDPRVMRR